MEPDVETNSEQPTNPAVPNTIYVITWNQIATTSPNINLWAEIMFSTERTRRRSRNFHERET